MYIKETLVAPTDYVTLADTTMKPVISFTHKRRGGFKGSIIIAARSPPSILLFLQIRAEMRLDEITSHPIHLASTNALTGNGLDEAFQWLSDTIVHNLNSVK